MYVKYIKEKSDLRRFECPGTELNRYDRCGSQDFKSCVSTSSTTGAVVFPYNQKSFSISSLEGRLSRKKIHQRKLMDL